MLASFRKYGFYTLAAIEALILVGMIFQYSITPNSGSDSGGAEMGLFFFILFPLLALSVIVLIYRFVAISFVRIAATLILVAPLGFAIRMFVLDGSPDATQEAFDAGRGIFAEGPPTALAEAIARDDFVRVAALASKVDVNQPGAYGYRFLTFAMIQPSIDNRIVASLLKAGADPNGPAVSPLMNTVFANDAARLNMLLDAGADPNRYNADGEPELFYTTDNPEMLRILLRRGANADIVDAKGWTTLMVAARDGKWPAVSVLLDGGADPGRKANDGTGLAAIIAHFRETEKQAGRAPPPELLALERRLAQQ